MLVSNKYKRKMLVHVAGTPDEPEIISVHYVTAPEEMVSHADIEYIYEKYSKELSEEAMDRHMSRMERMAESAAEERNGHESTN